MSQQVASLHAEIGAKVDGFTQGASKVKSDLGGLASDIGKTTGQFNGQFKAALLGGKANMDSFGSSLLDQADKAGLSTEEMLNLSKATGIYSDEQIKVAQATVNVTAKAEELSAAVKNGEMTAEQAGEAFKNYAKSQEVAKASTISLQAVMTVGIPIILAVVGALFEMEKAADAAARGDARLEAVLYSTGEAAGYNFEQLNSMADGLSKITGIDDDLIKKQMAVQATFTNISGKVFPEATKAVLNFTAVFGGDLLSNSKTVNKALNDFSGFTALKKSGVSFSEEQIKQIARFKETNDLIGYQELVLKELNKEFGNAAKKMYEAGDKSEGVAIAWGNLTEEAGGGLVPVMRSVNEYLMSSIDGWNAYLQGLQSVSSGFAESDNIIVKWLQGGAWVIKTTGDIVDGNNQQAEAQDKLSAYIMSGTDAIDELAGANQAYVPSAEEVEAANKAISDSIQGIVGLIQSMQDAEDAYTEKSIGLAQERRDAEAELALLRAQGYLEQGEQITGAIAKLEEIKAKEAELAAERAKQTLQFVSNILAENLARDGWTQSEFDAFAKQQQAWGLWSADVVAKAKDAWMEADKITSSINGIPTEKNVSINITTNRSEGEGLPPPKPGENLTPRASGGPAKGMTWVGENGPEAVSLPAGSYVHTNRTSQNMGTSGGGGITVNIVYNASMDGADEQQVASRLGPAFEMYLRQKGLV